MKGNVIFAGGILMAPISAFVLLGQWSIAWVLCPQALVVMFLRQMQHSYDSLGAADIPDLVVGVAYYPIIGWMLRTAAKQNRLSHVAIRIAFWHVVTIGLAWSLAMVRNKVWGIGMGGA